MRRFIKGELKAFELIVARYKDQVFNFTYRSLGDYHRAEDITQDIFLRIIKNAHKYHPENRFKSWIYKIAANLCKNEIRDRQRRNSHISDISAISDDSDDDDDNDRLSATRLASLMLDSTPTPDELYEKKQTQLAVQRAIGSLPELQRLAIILREYHDFSYAEIAYSLGCSISSVKSTIYRARQLLRQRLTKTIKD